MPPYPDDVDCSTLNKGAFSAFSNASDATGSTDSRYGSTSFLDAGFGTRARTRGLRGHRRLLMDAQKRRQDQQVEESADAKRFNSRMFGSTGVDGREATALTSHHHVDHSSEVSSHANSRLGSKNRHTHKHGTSSAVSGSESALGAPPSSVLSRLEDHMITPGDAADADDPGHYILPKPGMEGDDELDLCCGENAWWKPSTIAIGFDRIVVLAEWDHELKRIVTLSIPFILTALLLGINQTITVTLVSQFIGTDAVVAFVLVELVLGLTYAFFCGFVSTEATLCSQAVGARNFKLAGQYVQICAAIFTICMIPNIVIWSFVIEDVIHLFGFGAKVANIGHMYAVVLLFRQWISGVNYAYHGLLNVIDREKWCTFISVAEDSVGVLAILGVVLTKETTLQEIGLIKLGVSVVFFVFNSWYTVYRGWVNDYLEGMLGSCALYVRQAYFSLYTDF
jgi:MatE